jgi:ribosomal protein S18 acetylase RimI-like enzyme
METDGMPGMEIRAFDIKDYDEVLRVWKQAGLILRPGDDLEEVRLKLQRDPDLFLLAIDKDEIVGSVMGGWDGRRGWIYHLAVKPSRQGEGIAKAILRELEKRLATKGARKVNAQVYQTNTKSLQFFKACGYEVHPDLIMIGKILGG